MRRPMSQGPFDLTLDPLASPLRQPRVARAITWTLAILLAFASLVICAVVGGARLGRDCGFPASARAFIGDVPAADR